MAEKKTGKKDVKTKASTKAKVSAKTSTKAKASAKVVAPKAKATKSKPKKPKEAQSDDMGIVIVDDDITIDQEKVNEERRAYLEESRSQEAFD